MAVLAGSIYTAVGLLRLGWLTNFLSHSVIAGFMTGASIIIGLSQVSPAATSPPSLHVCHHVLPFHPLPRPTSTLLLLAHGSHMLIMVLPL